MFFMGTYQNNVDPKGRVSIPVKYREALGEHFFVSKGFDNCVDIYTQDEWEKFAQKLHKLSVTKRDMRDFVRFIFGNATEVELDKQGRILLPAMLRETVGIEKEVIVMGVGNKVEIWSRSVWEEHQQVLSQHISEISENVGAFDVDVDLDI